MRNIRLPQTLILDPQVSFSQLAGGMEAQGWQRVNVNSTTPMIKDEPETASWTWQGGKPFVIYSFNPVAHLRVLDVATLPPVFRQAVVNVVPILSEQQVDHLLFADTPRDRLLALWAAQETERIDLVIQTERLINDPDPLVGEQAQRVTDKLKRIREARMQTLVSLQSLVQAAPELIRRLDNAEFVASLKPSEKDYKKLFDEGLVEKSLVALDDYYQRYYQQKAHLHHLSADARIKVTAVPAGLLRWSNELSDKFPGGYRDISGWMNPACIWMTWTIQDGSTVRYDGLAWVGDHWVWLPKIYRVLGPLCLSGRLNQNQMH